MDIERIKLLYANAEFDKVVAQIGTSSNADLLSIKAYSLQKLGRFEEAMLCWNALIDQLPEVAQFYNERASCKFNLKFRHAMDDFNQAIELDPGNPYFYACRAFVKDKTGDIEGAIEDYIKANELDPDDATVLNNLGIAQQKLGYTAKAREFFKQSDDLLGINPERYSELPEPTLKSTGPAPTFKDKLREVKHMLSSLKEFKLFLQELFRKS